MMYLIYKTVAEAKARNNAEALCRFAPVYTPSSEGDPRYWWHMPVADNGRAALQVNESDMPQTDEEGNVTYHSLTAAEVESLIKELPSKWNAQSGI